MQLRVFEQNWKRAEWTAAVDVNCCKLYRQLHKYGPVVNFLWTWNQTKFVREWELLLFQFPFKPIILNLKCDQSYVLQLKKIKYIGYCNCTYIHFLHKPVTFRSARKIAPCVMRKFYPWKCLSEIRELKWLVYVKIIHFITLE